MGLLTVATITGTSQHGGPPSATASSWISWVAIVALNCFAAGGVAWVTSLRDQQHELRVKAIEDLTEANAKLEAQRVEGLSGSLAVESEPGSGTTIAGSIPVIPAASSVTAEVPLTRMPVPAQAR